MTGRSYTPEQKAQAVKVFRELREKGKSLADLNLSDIDGIPMHTVYNWARKKTDPTTPKRAYKKRNKHPYTTMEVHPVLDRTDETITISVSNLLKIIKEASRA